jgi:hypothetical protein
MHSSWLARSSVAWGRSSPFRRTVDRIERRVLTVAVALALAAVPVAVLTGAAVQRSADVLVEVQNADAYPTTATLLRDAPENSADSTIGVDTTLGEWHTAIGTARTGPVPVPIGATAGTTVRIWLDDAGRVVDPPLTADQAYWRGVVTAVLLLIAAFAVLAAGYWLTHHLLDRRRLAEWEADWRTVEPRWTHRD